MVCCSQRAVLLMETEAGIYPQGEDVAAAGIFPKEGGWDVLQAGEDRVAQTECRRTSQTEWEHCRTSSLAVEVLTSRRCVCALLVLLLLLAASC